MRTCIIIVCALIGLCACTEERAGYYIGEDAYVQFYYSGYFFTGRPSSRMASQQNYSMGLSETNLSDTLYFRIYIVGNESDSPRRVRLKTYVPEESTLGFYTAEEGVDFVSFDDPALESYLTVPGDTAYYDIPVIVKYNPEKVGYNMEGYFQLIDSEDLIVGDTCLTKARFYYYSY